MKILYFLLAIIFLVFASMKLNDPQPIPWILMYGVMSVICIMAMFNVYYKWLIVALAIPVIYYAASVHLSAMEWVHSGGSINNEEARDFFELSLVLLVLISQGFQSFRKS